MAANKGNQDGDEEQDKVIDLDAYSRELQNLREAHKALASDIVASDGLQAMLDNLSGSAISRRLGEQIQQFLGESSITLGAGDAVMPSSALFGTADKLQWQADIVNSLVAPSTSLANVAPRISQSLGGVLGQIDTRGIFEHLPSHASTSELSAQYKNLLQDERVDYSDILSSYLPSFQTNLATIEDAFTSNFANAFKGTSPLASSPVSLALEGVQNSFRSEVDKLAQSLFPNVSDSFSSAAFGGLLNEVISQQQTALFHIDELPSLNTLLGLDVESLLMAGSPSSGFHIERYMSETELEVATGAEATIPELENAKQHPKFKFAPWQVLLLQTLLATLLALVVTDLYNYAKNAVKPEDATEVQNETTVNDLKSQDAELLRKLTEFEAFATPILLKVFEVQEYVVIRNAPLRVDADAKSTVETRVHPNTRVDVQELRGNWVYVGYQDDLAGIERMGWIHKKHLKSTEARHEELAKD